MSELNFRSLISITLIIFTTVCLQLKSNVFGQARTQPEGVPDEKFARAMFLGGDFVTAIKEYELVLKKDSANVEANYNLGFCYLNTTINKARAIPLLEFAIASPKVDVQAQYDLARAYMSNYRFDDAIAMFSQFKKNLNGAEDKNYITADMQLEICATAKEMVANPVNVVFENLGARINSPFPDYNPYVNKTETQLFYTSKRPGNVGNLLDYDGYFSADVLLSENKYGTWEKAKRLPPTLNTPLVEETTGLSSDASYLFVYIDNLDARFQTRLAQKQGRTFQRLLPMGNNVNAPGRGANSVTITNDKKTIFFSAKLDDAIGGYDIYMSKLMPSGEFGPPVNVGPVINTSFDDDYPYLAPDGKTFYFASAGHKTMGGYDLMRCTWDKATNTFSKPENLGYPINTPDDNTTISFTASGRYAYISDLRPGGFGNLDIWRVTFNDVTPAYTAVKITLSESDSTSIYEIYRKKLKNAADSLVSKLDSVYIASHKIPDSTVKNQSDRLAKLKKMISNGPEVEIKAYDKTTHALIGKYQPNRTTGNAVVILPPGEFTIVARCEGYKEYKDELRIEDREMSVKEITRNFSLSKN